MNPASPSSDDFLVEPRTLLAECAGERPPILVDARTPQAYASGHLPGARHLTTYGLFVRDTTPEGMAEFVREAAARYGAIGVTREQPVVVYEDATGMRAARELWILELLGHTSARMLHGGQRDWIAAGGAIDADPVRAEPANFVASVCGALTISADEIHAQRGRAGRTLVDVRDADEYAGRDHTECCTRRGHLPGAVWIEWTDALENGRYRAPQALREHLRARGVAETDEIVPYCHRGARSASFYYALRRAGFGRIRNYIGSFHEWSARAEFPIES